jgi:broad specificity phosphatase PhoE
MRAPLRVVGLAVGMLLPADALLAADAPTIVLVVRHAEKASDTTDPPLSDAGRARADALAHVAGSAGVSAVFHTQFKRTQQTVAPLAARLNLTPITHPANDTPGLVSAIQSKWRGRTVVVAGHSNSVPEIVKGLAGVAMDDIPDAQFDNLYVVVLPPAGAASLTQLKYGAPTP